MTRFLGLFCTAAARVDQMVHQIAASKPPLLQFHVQFAEKAALGHASSSGQLLIQQEGYLLAAQVDLHNRTDLQADLRKAGRPVDQSWSDGRLLLEAYWTWNQDMLNRLVGDFSFVMWDPVQQALFGARDQMGTYGLFFLSESDRVWVANTLGDLADLGAPIELNPDYFSAFCSQNGMVDSLLTPYKGIGRVASGHWLRVDAEGTRVQRYWELSSHTQSIRYRTQDEYLAHFRSLLREAVRCRLSRTTPNVVALSGGLDSTAIFALAKELEAEGSCGPIQTLSFTFQKDKAADERPFIESVLRYWSCEGQFYSADELMAFRGFPNDTPPLDEPKVATTTYGFTRHMAELAKNQGGHYLITGFGGDHLLAGHPSVASDWLRSGRLFAALREPWLHAYPLGLSPVAMLWHWVLGPLVGLGAVREFLQGKAPADQAFIKRLPLSGQQHLYSQWLGTAGQFRHDQELQSEVGVTLRHPFLDRRLWEFMFQIPSELRWQDGWTKWIVRQAFRGRVPDDVLDRTDKTAHMGSIFDGIREHWSLLYSAVRPCRISRLGLANGQDFLNTLAAFRQGQVVQDTVWAHLTLELWLYKAENRDSLWAKPGSSKGEDGWCLP